MTKPLILLLLTATLFVGCSQEETPDPGRRGVEVRFTLPQIEQQSAQKHETPQLPATRALLGDRTTVRVVAYKAATGVTTPQETNYVAEQTYVADASGALTPCTVKADGSFAAPAPAQALWLIAGEYDFFATTPALPLDATHTMTDVPNGVDYATSRTAGIAVLPVDDTKNVALTQLQRQTARILLLVQKDPGYTALNLLQVDAAAGKRGVVLEGLAPTQSGATLGATLTPGTGAAGNKLTFPAAAFTQTDPTQLTLTTYVLPKTAADIPLSYDLVLGKLVSGSQKNTQKTITGTVPSITFAAGGSYRLILTVGATSAILSVDQWQTGGNPDNSLGN